MMYDKILRTEDGSLTLVHEELDQAYHSHMGAQKEAIELYLKSSGFEQNLPTHPHLWVLDVGLGLGYNAFSTISYWHTHQGSQNLSLVSLERDETLVRLLTEGKGKWMKNWPDHWFSLATSLIPTEYGYQLSLPHPYHNGNLLWNIYVGEAERWPYQEYLGKFHYCFHDPFSPEKNPRMWSRDWFAKLSQVACQNIVLVTYSVARVVRDHLTAAGWECMKIPTPGSKKAWLKAKLARPTTVQGVDE